MRTLLFLVSSVLKSVPDQDLEIRGGGGASPRPIHKGEGELVSKKILFSPAGLSLVSK